MIEYKEKLVLLYMNNYTMTSHVKVKVIDNINLVLDTPNSNLYHKVDTSHSIVNINKKDTIESYDSLNKDCPICFDPLHSQISNTDTDSNNRNKCVKTDKTPVTLECGHTFHHDCIVDWFKPQQKLNSYKKYCPYCRIKVKYVPLPTTVFPIKYIHKEYKIIENFILNNQKEELSNYCHPLFDSSLCNSILKAGKNKGYQCSKSRIGNSLFCKIHSKKYTQISDGFIDDKNI